MSKQDIAFFNMVTMQPFEEMPKEAAPAMFTHLLELFNSESEDETESVEIPEELVGGRLRRQDNSPFTNPWGYHPI